MKLIRKIFPIIKPDLLEKATLSLPKLMEMHGILADVIPKAPRQLAEVIYPDNVAVLPGMELSPTEVKDRPSVTWDCHADTFHLLCMLDPDAPSRCNPTMREWHHWMIGNIPECKIEEGTVYTDYIGPAPPENTGLHRYIFLVYKQKEPIYFKFQRQDNKTVSRRGNFSIFEITKKHGLGDPIAGNFFHARWNELVPNIYKQYKI